MSLHRYHRASSGENRAKVKPRSHAVGGPVATGRAFDRSSLTKTRIGTVMDFERVGSRGEEDVLKDLFSVEGKVAVVTGGSRGIGEMIARGLVEAGAKVYVSSRKADVCEAVAKALSASGTAIPVAAD